LFDRVVEYPLAAVLVCFLVLWPSASNILRRYFLPAFGLTAPAAWLLCVLLIEAPQVVDRARSFFGVYQVRFDPQEGAYELLSGLTVHGRQFADPAKRNVPLTYYHRDGPIGQVFGVFDGPRAKRHVAVVGLGIGTLACYARPGQHWTFYEIDPAVVRLAWDTRHFTHLEDCRRRGVDMRIVLGDARLRLEDAAGGYGLLVLDAFNSDAIPVHLLTRQALHLYLSKLAPEGIVAVHVSNRYADLVPLMAALAEDAGLVGYYQADPGERRTGRKASVWVVLARRPEHLGRLTDNKSWEPLPEALAGAVWTDDYSNVFSVLR
jgi:hypothetical protein